MQFIDTKTKGNYSYCSSSLLILIVLSLLMCPQLINTEIFAQINFDFVFYSFQIHTLKDESILYSCTQPILN